MQANVKINVCGKISRELVSETFVAHPINKFGALMQGVHVYFESEAESCEGKADFVMIWKNTNEKWKTTRVLSYGHRTND